jgi:nickel transport protein
MKKRLLFLTALAAAILSAHDIEITVEHAPPAVVVRTTYAGTEPALYAAVLVYAPGKPETEYQNGRTDENGVFSFVPNVRGEWRFVVDDEMGHRTELSIPVDLARRGAAEGAIAAQMPLRLKLVTGLSVILGLTGLLYGYKARQDRRTR